MRGWVRRVDAAATVGIGLVFFGCVCLADDGIGEDGTIFLVACRRDEGHLSSADVDDTSGTQGCPRTTLEQLRVNSETIAAVDGDEPLLLLAIV